MTRTLDDVEGPHAGARLVVAGAPAAAAEVAAVLVHGRGGTPEGLVRLLREVSRPGVTLIAPGARRASWFPTPHDGPTPRNEPALTSAVDCVDAAIDVARAAGVPAERTVLVGVSQGGCVVAEHLRRRPRRFGGAFVVSAALPGPRAEFDDDVAEHDADLDGTPVLLSSSESDPAVPVDRVHATARTLDRLGAAVETRLDPGAGHGLSDATMTRIGDRLDALLSASGASGRS